jgi:thiol-disulfide isomerase/thioredoxin
VRNLLLIILVFSLAATTGCLVIENQFAKIPPGTWRATLDLSGKQPMTSTQQANIDDEDIERNPNSISETILPFTMEVKYYEDKPDDFYIEIINGRERIRVDDITFGRTKERATDTLRINFPHFDTYITGTFSERVIKGYWVVNYKENYKIPFKAVFGENYRFTELSSAPKADLSGKWATIFGLSDKDPYPAIGEFSQNNNSLTGTFRTETGDYRFLEGTVQEDKFYLSCFDGAHAFLYNGKIISNDSIIGSFRSGNHYTTTWEAVKNEAAELQHPDSLTFMNPGYDKFSFTFPDTKGQMISLDDEAFQGKVKIIQILGTWCPNCLDETTFLKEYLKTHNNDKLAVIGLAFERYKDQEKNAAIVEQYIKTQQVPYPILLAGKYDKKEAAIALPMLSDIVSYPTMIFLNKDNEVIRIHTGFNGPATTEYEEFKQDFEKFVGSLTNSKEL